MTMEMTNVRGQDYACNIYKNFEPCMINEKDHWVWAECPICGKAYKVPTGYIFPKCHGRFMKERSD